MRGSSAAAEGGLVALFYLNRATFGPLSGDELAFVRELAERIPAAVERARAEVAWRGKRNDSRC